MKKRRKSEFTPPPIPVVWDRRRRFYRKPRTARLVLALAVVLICSLALYETFNTFNSAKIDAGETRERKP